MLGHGLSAHLFVFVFRFLFMPMFIFMLMSAYMCVPGCVCVTPSYVVCSDHDTFLVVNTFTTPKSEQIRLYVVVVVIVIVISQTSSHVTQLFIGFYSLPYQFIRMPSCKLERITIANLRTRFRCR